MTSLFNLILSDMNAERKGVPPPMRPLPPMQFGMQKMADKDASTEPVLISMADAKASGLSSFFTGKLCPKGHISRRSVYNRSCNACHAEREAKTRREHPEKIAKRYRTYVSRGPERVTANSRAWRSANPDKIRESGIRTNEKKRNGDPRGYWVSKVFCGARARAIKHALPFAITREYLLSITTEFCPALGVRMIYGAKSERRGPHPHSASIDKVIPNLGYVPGNVVVISHRANSIKQDASLGELEMLTAWVATVTKTVLEHVA